jgi:hypothetical protein
MGVGNRSHHTSTPEFVYVFRLGDHVYGFPINRDEQWESSPFNMLLKFLDSRLHGNDDFCNWLIIMRN